jgi:cytochrome c biogenesis protein CcmG/thiol:disulfide interchange protein DsbE
MRKPLWIAFGTLAIAVLAGIFALALNLAGREGARPREGGPAPDFTLALYQGFESGLGSSITLSQLRGKVVVINFWASWCAPCRDEAPDLERVWRLYRDKGAIVIGIDELDTESAAIAYLKSFDITYPNGLDLQQRVGKQSYRITGQPETFIVDKKGVLRHTYIQPVNEQELRLVIDRLLAE